jgi:flagellar biosynthesis anti-sigma factor FlgM
MKIQRTSHLNGVQGVERTPAAGDAQSAEVDAKAPADRVTMGASPPPSGEEARVAELLRSTRARASALRSSKLEQIEAALKKGEYRPDAGRIADQILTAAEIDARLRAMMQKG